MTSLWPDDLTLPNNPQSPVRILITQADYLAGLTQGRVMAEVVPHESSNGKVSYGMRLIAPQLGNHRTWLLTMTYDIEKMYPVAISTRQRLKLTVYNEADFIETLRDIFHFVSTVTVIAQMVSHVNLREEQ